MLRGEKKSGQVRLSFWENKQNVNESSGIQTSRVLTDYLWQGNYGSFFPSFWLSAFCAFSMSHVSGFFHEKNDLEL